MIRRLIHIKETIATVIGEETALPAAEAEIARQRCALEDYIRRDPEFARSLAPRRVPEDAPAVVRRMADAAARMGVGPMAAVAGAIAASALEALRAAGAEHAVVDNGGDIALIAARPVTIGVFAGPSPIKDIGLRVEPRPGVLGVCTSSGTVGHSLSFGRADAAVVIALDPCLADAAATALGNAVTANDPALIEDAMAGLLIDDIEGMLVIIEDTLAVCGRLPEIVRVPVDPARISTIRA
ncbi:MAG: UPF0280 family protein [Candidatus Aminicenantes bacterium]|nr:UPF0280 family protein [Candidatus Aminicenantes bacterium]